MDQTTGNGIIAIVAALGGGVFVKIVDGHYRMREKGLDAGAELRKELHDELDALRSALKVVQVELDEWKEKYYKLLETSNELKLDNARMSDRIEQLSKKLIEMSGLGDAN